MEPKFPYLYLSGNYSLLFFFVSVPISVFLYQG